MQRLVLSSVCALILGAAGCVPEDQSVDSVDPDVGRRTRAEWPAEVLAQVDSGNAAIRAADAGGALAHYSRATEKAPDNSTAWFGVYMAQNALGNTAAADSALARVRNLAPGATLVPPPDGGGDDGAG